MSKRSMLPMLVLLATFSAISVPSHAGTDGLVRVEVFKAGLIAGAATGRGVLNFQGHHYRFKMRGLSLGVSAGISASRLSGHVGNLHQLGDFAGTYTAIGLGGAWVLGTGLVQLTNYKGVTISLQGERGGIEFAANLSGINIELECGHQSCARPIAGPAL